MMQDKLHGSIITIIPTLPHQKNLHNKFLKDRKKEKLGILPCRLKKGDKKILA